jgi:hypothetical protein
MLITGGLNDPRVTYWEPAKWAARLRATKTDDNLLLLKINMGAGHGGKSGRYEALHERAEAYAFVLTQVGAARVIAGISLRREPQLSLESARFRQRRARREGGEGGQQQPALERAACPRRLPRSAAAASR